MNWAHLSNASHYHRKTGCVCRGSEMKPSASQPDGHAGVPLSLNSAINSRTSHNNARTLSTTRTKTSPSLVTNTRRTVGRNYGPTHRRTRSSEESHNRAEYTVHLEPDQHQAAQVSTVGCDSSPTSTAASAATPPAPVALNAA